MPESPPLHTGETRIVRGSGGTPYEIKNVGGVYSCSCSAWRNQGRNPHYRTCKHLVEFRGARDEAQRIAPGGRGSMPSTTARLLEGYWPSTGNAALPRPEPGDAHMRALAGSEAMRYAPSLTVRMPARGHRTGDPIDGRVSMIKGKKKAHNAWTKLLDDDSPLADPEPPPAPPANDVATAKAVPSDEPKWTSPAPAEGSGLVTTTAPVPDVSAMLAVDVRGLPAMPPVTGAFGVLLAQSWDGVQNITGWLMSEKLDGLRAYWDGEQFRSRQNNVFSTPEWYREQMPKGVHLDGELWMGRGRFQETTGYVRRLDAGEHWHNIQYQVFDAPSVPGGFEERFAAIGRDFTLPSHATKLPHTPCPNIPTLKAFLEQVEERGGEGVMLRQPGSRYYRARSSTLLKVKTFFDTEVVVVGTLPGKGRHVGAVGALQVIVPESITLRAGKKTCTLIKGTRFEVGTGLSDIQRRAGAIPNGVLITARFQELSKDGIPRFPSMIGVRDYE